MDNKKENEKKEGGLEKKPKFVEPSPDYDSDDEYEEIDEEENFVYEIEIDDDDNDVDEIEYIVEPPSPPPPFMHGFPPPPPPPPFMRGFPPPPHPFENHIIEYEEEVDDDDIIEGDYDDMYEDGDEEEEPHYEESKPPEKYDVKIAPSLSKMRSESADKIRERGEAQAHEIFSEKIWSFVRKSLLVLFYIVLIALMSTGAYFYIRTHNNEEVNRSSAIKNSADSSYRMWRLNQSRSNEIVRSFYESIGGVSAVAAFKDMLMMGTVEIGGKEEEFYCIKKASCEAFLKIGSGREERVYLIASISEPIEKLVEGRAFGKRSKIGDKESIVLKAMVSFDDLLFLRAFGDVGVDSRLSAIVYDSYEKTNDANLNVLSVFEDEKYTVKYSFDDKTKLLVSSTITIGEFSVRTEFGDYADDDANSFKIPRTRTIYFNNNKFARITINLVKKNRGLIFPQ